MLRITRKREKSGAKTAEYAYGIASLAEDDARESLALDSGHRSVENTSRP